MAPFQPFHIKARRSAHGHGGWGSVWSTQVALSARLSTLRHRGMWHSSGSVLVSKGWQRAPTWDLQMLGICVKTKCSLPELAVVPGFASELQIHPRCWNWDSLVGATKKGKHIHKVWNGGGFLGHLAAFGEQGSKRFSTAWGYEIIVFQNIHYSLPSTATIKNYITNFLRYRKSLGRKQNGKAQYFTSITSLL